MQMHQLNYLLLLVYIIVPSYIQPYLLKRQSRIFDFESIQLWQLGVLPLVHYSFTGIATCGSLHPLTHPARYCAARRLL